MPGPYQLQATPYASAVQVLPSSSASVAPPPPSSNQTDYQQLPAGWTTAISPEDGRLYYWEQATGRTSWSHPMAPPKSAASLGSNAKQSVPIPYGLPHQENPFHATRKPDTHECNAVVALILFPPLGLLAIYHSLSVNPAWESGRYGDAVTHSRQAPKYASFATCVGIGFWIWYFFFRGGFDWPDWNFGDR